MFKDITPLLADPHAFKTVIDTFTSRYADQNIDAIVGIDARGFIFGGALAYRLGLPFIPVRKFGKLPYKTHHVEYDLEYSTDKIELHIDALSPNHSVVIIDDLLATGGTAAATCELIEKTGASIAECVFVIELAFLEGREKLKGRKAFSLVQY